uniref:Protein ENL n=1 Tax=Ascaris suum TaxID=6253 RepID=F1L316_ASCSU
MTTVSRALLRLFIGHKSEMLDRPTSEGHTHRWTVFVRSAGPLQFVDRSFVTKVVFELHPDFANPHRVVKDPPFEVTETGYAGFSIPVNISFSGTSKTYRLHYDMNLCLEKQSEHKVEHILEFKQPSNAFYDLIMKYGGVMKKDKKKEKHRQKDKEAIGINYKKDKGGVAEDSKIKKEKNREPSGDVRNRKEKEITEEPKMKKERDREPSEECKNKKDGEFFQDESTSAERTKNVEIKEEMEKPKEQERSKTVDSEEREKTKRNKVWNDDQQGAKKAKNDNVELESLVALQRKLMTLCDVERLQAIVEAVIASGPTSGLHSAQMCLSEDNFLSFDLCALSASLISQFEEICSRKV